MAIIVSIKNHIITLPLPKSIILKKPTIKRRKNEKIAANIQKVSFFLFFLLIIILINNKTF